MSYIHHSVRPKKIPSKNVLLAKRAGIQLVMVFLYAMLLLAKVLAGMLWVAYKGILITGTALSKAGILPLYRQAKRIKITIKRITHYAQRQFGANFSRNVVLYGGLILISLFATANNIKARELRPQEIGRDSSLYVLLADFSDAALIEEISTAQEGYNAPLQKNTTDSLSAVGVRTEVALVRIQEETENNLPLTGSSDAIIKPELLGTDASVRPREKIITYIVQEGDTISEIAEQFNVSTNTIIWENNIGPRDFIKPGQEIVILPVTGVSHTVQRGDTLDGIANRYRAKSEDILEVNRLTDASELQIGTKVVIPDGFPPAPARPTVVANTGLSSLGNIFKPAPAVAGAYNWPVNSKRITQYFRGWRHTGIDIGASTGTAIYAADDGIVTTAGWNSGGYGLYIVVDHGGGISTLYAHTSKVLVKKGDRIKKGSVIAEVGSTGRSTGPHLHFEVRIGGNRINPLDYL